MDFFLSSNSNFYFFFPHKHQFSGHLQCWQAVVPPAAGAGMEGRGAHTTCTWPSSPIWWIWTCWALARAQCSAWGWLCCSSLEADTELCDPSAGKETKFQFTAWAASPRTPQQSKPVPGIHRSHSCLLQTHRIPKAATAPAQKRNHFWDVNPTFCSWRSPIRTKPQRFPEEFRFFGHLRTISATTTPRTPLKTQPGCCEK